MSIQKPQNPNAVIGERFTLWVDAVGGFLVCQSDEVVIGQSGFKSEADLPILGDLKKQHAVLKRSGEGYVITPIGAVCLNNQRIHEPASLPAQCELQLGSAIRLEFTRPHPLSLSACLRFMSRHSTEPMADGVILMAESLVMGPKNSNHIVCRDWSDDVVLSNHGGELYCRAMDTFEIDGKLCDGRGRLRRDSHVAGEDFSLSLEPVPW